MIVEPDPDAEPVIPPFTVGTVHAKVLDAILDDKFKLAADPEHIAVEPANEVVGNGLTTTA